MDHVRRIIACCCVAGLAGVFWVGGPRAATAASPQASFVASNVSSSLNLPPGTALTISLMFKNTGTTAWRTAGHKGAHLHIADRSGRAWYHPFWRDRVTPAWVLEHAVAAGSVGTFRFALRAPLEHGTYPFTLQLWDGETELRGGRYVMTVIVGEKPAPKAAVPSAQEPLMRVEITEEMGTAKIRGSGAYQIRDAQDHVIATATGGELAEVDVQRAAGRAFITLSDSASSADSGGGRVVASSNEPLRFVPLGDTILELVSFERRPAWNLKLNDNTFRGVFELHPKSGSTWWVMNELPLELYLRGLGEVNEAQPYEHIKALVTAARTYAQYHITNDKKHPNEPFHLNATANDQIYLGYGFEQRAPTVQRAVAETRGLMVTYAGEPIIAAYSCCTDGRTRAWREVWGKDQPWAQSVEDPHGVIASASSIPGNHMVGLSGRGSEGFARAGKTFEEILKYYYTGVEVVKRY